MHGVNDGLGSTDYQAEEGMTWGEWLASEYNTDGYLLASATNKDDESTATLIVNADKTRYVISSKNDILQYADTIITNDRSYILSDNDYTINS